LANSTYDANELQVIKNTLENVGYDLHEYMLAHAYNTISDQCFNNTFGPRYSRVSNIPSDELVRLSTDIVGSEIAESFAAWNDFTIRQDDEEASILPSQIGRTAIK